MYCDKCGADCDRCLVVDKKNDLQAHDQELEAKPTHNRDGLLSAMRRLEALKQTMGDKIPIGASAALTCITEALGKDGE